MRILKSGVFEDDIKKLDGSYKQRLQKAIKKILEQPELGKPMEHFTKVFAERVDPFRLIYVLKNDEIHLICFKNRDEVYEYLRSLQGQL